MPAFDTLADTSAVIPWLRGERAATKFLESRRFGINVVTLAELQVGALRSDDAYTTLNRLAWLLRHTPIVSVTEQTALAYATICTALQTIGRPTPINDIWIAASALEWNVPLIARDAHFSRIDGLTMLSC